MYETLQIMGRATYQPVEDFFHQQDIIQLFVNVCQDQAEMRDRQMKSEYLQANKLKDFGRVFKDVLVSSLPGEMIQFD